MNFGLVPCNDLYFEQYRKYCLAQRGYDPVRPLKSLFVAGDNGSELIAGCLLLETAGPYILADGYVRDPNADAKIVYNATLFMQYKLKEVATTQNKAVICVVGHPGLKKLLAANGYIVSQSELFFYIPGTGIQGPEYSSLVPKKKGKAPIPETKVKRKRGRPRKVRPEESKRTVAEKADKYGDL